MRNTLRLAAFAAAAFAAAPGEAALAPNYQRLAELRAILNDQAVTAAFGDTPIEAVAYLGPDRYRVTAGSCRLDVRIVDLPMPRNMAGARRFEVRVGEKACG